MKNYETILPFSCCPLVFPEKWGPQNLKSGWAPKFQEIEVFCRISTEALDPANSGKFIKIRTKR